MPDLVISLLHVLFVFWTLSFFLHFFSTSNLYHNTQHDYLWDGSESHLTKRSGPKRACCMNKAGTRSEAPDCILLLWSSIVLLLTFIPMVDRTAETMAQRVAIASNPLTTIPTQVRAPKEGIPNTPLAASTVSFLLGAVFSLGAATFLFGGFSYWWTTYQLGFFAAAWAAFHWAEFAVTAGWNIEKCSVDCEAPVAVFWGF